MSALHNLLELLRALAEELSFLQEVAVADVKVASMCAGLSRGAPGMLVLLLALAWSGCPGGDDGDSLSSGAVRNHKPDIMYRAFEIVGHDRAFVDDHFGGMLSAFRYGAPPHAGIAPGIDRIVMLLAGADNLREVIMFPMNQRAEDLMMGAPSAATNEQLRDLGIRLIPKG
jgi:hypothetical protein